MPPAPAFASANTAGDLVMLYWMQLMKDVHFEMFPFTPIVGEAVMDLSKLSDYVGEAPVR